MGSHVDGGGAGGEGGGARSSGSGDATGGDSHGGAVLPKTNNPKTNNPDNLPESSSPIYSNNFETDDADGVVFSRPGIAVGKWSDTIGYGPSGGWQFRPDPTADPKKNEASAGWLLGVDRKKYLAVDAHHLITVSYMYKVSQALLREIARGGPFWAHDQKAIDFKYHDPNAPYGEGHRNTIHFGESNGKVRSCHVDGGGGTRIYFGPDWLTLADEWVWLCHVIDMRGATPAERYVATYMKRKRDTAVTKIGIRYEDGTPKLQPYDLPFR